MRKRARIAYITVPGQAASGAISVKDIGDWCQCNALAYAAYSVVLNRFYLNKASYRFAARIKLRPKEPSPSQSIVRGRLGCDTSDLVSGDAWTAVC